MSIIRKIYYAQKNPKILYWKNVLLVSKQNHTKYNKHLNFKNVNETNSSLSRHCEVS